MTIGNEPRTLRPAPDTKRGFWYQIGRASSFFIASAFALWIVTTFAGAAFKITKWVWGF